MNCPLVSLLQDKSTSILWLGGVSDRRHTLDYNLVLFPRFKALYCPPSCGSIKSDTKY